MTNPKEIVKQAKGILPTITYAFFFNEIAGKSEDYSLEALKDQLKLIEEEVKELREALEANNPVETIDAVVDIQVVLSGMQQLLANAGIDVSLAGKLVTENNLSKFTPDVDVAYATVKSYKEKGIDCFIHHHEVSDLYVVKDTSNKVRKPVGFKAVDLTETVPVRLRKEGFKREYRLT
jgi:hypothetical protein